VSHTPIYMVTGLQSY